MKATASVLRWIGSRTLWQTARFLIILIAAPFLIAAAIGIGITLYLPITIAALVYNRTLAHWLNRPAFRPYW